MIPACPAPKARYRPVDVGIARIEGLDSDNRSTSLRGDLADAYEYPAEERRRQLGGKDANDQPVVVRTGTLSEGALLHSTSIDLQGNPLELHVCSKLPPAVTTGRDDRNVAAATHRTK
jgi:hypothetical protein